MKTKLENNMSKIMDLIPVGSSMSDNLNNITYGTKPEEPEQSKEPVTDEAKDDFKYARDNLRDLIDHGTVALKDLIEFARTSQSARDFEVVGTLMNSLVTANKDVLDIRQKYQKITGQEGGGVAAAGVTNNNLFVGTTSEILKIINSKGIDEE